MQEKSTTEEQVPWNLESGLPPPFTPEFGGQPTTVFENVSGMKERTLENPLQLNEKEASKKFLSDERALLAADIRRERQSNREHLALLQVNSIMLRQELESGQVDFEHAKKEYEKSSAARAGAANSVAGRVRQFIANTTGHVFDKDSALKKSVSEKEEELAEIARLTQEREEELEEINALIDGDTVRGDIKRKLFAHYREAGEMAQGKFESMRKSVEQVLLRNSAFIVHTFLLNEELRHNANSNVSQRATLEDDMDILLSLEPSVSTSSVVPGVRQGLWGGIGVVLGGGEVQGAVQTDNGTTVGGIKYRDGDVSSSQEIDEKVSDRRERGHNELVVNNPEVFGFFVSVNMDASGVTTGFGAQNPDRSAEQKKFMGHITLAMNKGMPPLVMTQDNRLFEFVSIGEDGVIVTGKEISPAQVASGKAGLPNEKRKELGEHVVSKNLFTRMGHQQEAKGIVRGLSGEGGSGEFSQEELVTYLKDNKGGFGQFPNHLKHLLADKEFMVESARFNPEDAYRYAGENLKNDVDFIARIYATKQESDSDIYGALSDEMKKNEDVALLALKHDNSPMLDVSFINNPRVWEKILDRKVAEMDPRKTFSRGIGEGEAWKGSVAMTGAGTWKTVDLSGNPQFIERLNSAYPHFKFEKYYDDILVTRLQ